jgi:hypothetical protein
MALFDGIENESSHGGRLCGVARAQAKLSPEDVAGLVRVLGNRDVSATAIARVLKDAGHPVQASAINRHRRGDCLCPA